MALPNAKATAVRLIDEALSLLGADRPLTFGDWSQAYRLVEAARYELEGDALERLSEDERRALFDPASLNR